MSQSQDYPLGYSEKEARRLAEQGALLEKLTEEVLQSAGVRQGMRVLDLGCGVGDVSLLVAKMVGAAGNVLGIDRAESSLETARRRAGSLSVANARFEQADVTTFDTDLTFDAIVGRFVLLYLRDPAAALRRLSRKLTPGGIVVFHELDISQVSQSPPSALFMQTRGWILQAFAASGAELDMGTKLYSTFMRAGLPTPEMIATTRVVCGPSLPGYDYMVQVLRSLLPLVERNGIATAAQVGIDTLATRIRDDAVAHERVSFMPRMVGAWARLADKAPEVR